MKKLIATILLLAGVSVGATAQHFVGASIGAGASHARIYAHPVSPSLESKFLWGTMAGGIAWKYYSPRIENGSAEQYLAGVAAELRYMQRGLMYNNSRNSADGYKFTFNSIILPVMWQPNFLPHSNKFRIFLNAGITLSYNFSATEHTILDGKVVSSTPYEMKLIRDNRFGYGLAGGLGFSLIFDKWELTLEGRYYFGYSDIWKRKTKYPTNPVRSPVDGLDISLGFFYRIGNDKNLPWKTEKRKIKDAQRAAEKAAVEAEMASRAEQAAEALEAELSVDPAPVFEETVVPAQEAIQPQVEEVAAAPITD